MEPLSVRKQLNSRNRVAKLSVRLTARPEAREALARDLAAARRKAEEKVWNEYTANMARLKDRDSFFDWDRMEYVGHEGEFDTEANGEENDRQFTSNLAAAPFIT